MRTRLASLVLLGGCALSAAAGLLPEPAAAAMPDPPTREQCAATKAATPFQ